MSVEGPPGCKGNIGFAGNRGETGPVGDTGPLGQRGKMGDKGPDGNQGDKGNKGIIAARRIPGRKGNRGPKGNPGVNKKYSYAYYIGCFKGPPGLPGTPCKCPGTPSSPYCISGQSILYTVENNRNINYQNGSTIPLDNCLSLSYQEAIL